MGMEFVKRPLWTGKLSDEKLKEYLDAVNEYELRGYTNSYLLLDTAETWYHSDLAEDLAKNLARLALDVYKEAASRWYESREEV